MIIFFIIIHLLYTIHVSVKIYKSAYLTLAQKRLNILLTFLIPFVWGSLALSMIKPSKVEVITKRNRTGKRQNSQIIGSNLLVMVYQTSIIQIHSKIFKFLKSIEKLKLVIHY
ncbi:MAG: hypothetical protein CMO01_28330 [Thalassobius sp.]|nr:hypothetical protein [Thalassovita sp.]